MSRNEFNSKISAMKIIWWKKALSIVRFKGEREKKNADLIEEKCVEQNTTNTISAKRFDSKNKEEKIRWTESSMKTYRRIWECMFAEPFQTRSMCTLHSARNQRFQINSIRLYKERNRLRDIFCHFIGTGKNEPFADSFLNLMPFP